MQAGPCAVFPDFVLLRHVPWHRLTFGLRPAVPSSTTPDHTRPCPIRPFQAAVPLRLRRCPTSFPNPNGLGASFNFTAWRTMGAIIGRELRSLWLQNVGEDHGSGLPHMGLDCWSPNVGIARDMRWGRNMETPGEDPLVNGLYGAAYALGMQQPDGTGVVQAIATLKHFAANSLEGNWSSPRCPDGLCTRHSIDANISAYDLASTYYPPFRTSVEMGGALGAMCSYNAINGVPSCANGPLLDGRLRGKWGFQVPPPSLARCLRLRQ